MSHACLLFIFRHLYPCLSILPISSSSILIICPWKKSPFDHSQHTRRPIFPWKKSPFDHSQYTRRPIFPWKRVAPLERKSVPSCGGPSSPPYMLPSVPPPPGDTPPQSNAPPPKDAPPPHLPFVPPPPAYSPDAVWISDQQSAKFFEEFGDVLSEVS